MAKTAMTVRAARAVHDEERERVKWGWQRYPTAFSARSSVILSDVGRRRRLECGSGCARGDEIVPDCTSCAGTDAAVAPLLFTGCTSTYACLRSTIAGRRCRAATGRRLDLRIFWDDGENNDRVLVKRDGRESVDVGSGRGQRYKKELSDVGER
jgi:hypothetical protein